jgi:hypothetical protein
MPGSVVTSAYTNPLTPLVFSNLASSAFNVGDQTINLGVTHNFTTGDSIWFNSNSLAHTAGLAIGVRYFVIAAGLTTIKLATTRDNAISGTSLTFTAANASVVYTFYKFYSLGRSSLKTISSYPCYAKSNIIFNSSIAVQIDVSIPAYQSVYNSYSELINTDHLIQLCGLRALSGGGSWYFGIGPSSFVMIQLSTGDSGIYLTGASTSGWKQRYIITPARQIQFWAGLTTPTLIYTSPALNANTGLVLEFGANFNNLAITDCTIKYL